jgi:hypothetical protein
MKKMKKFTKLASTALLAVGAITTSFGQGDQRSIGSKCGCPAVNLRPVANVTTKGTTNANGVTEFTGNVHLTCDTLWRLSGQVFVPNGKTITVDPGTVVQGIFNADPTLTGALVIERGAKIQAAGSKDCPIVFTTDLDDMSGSYSISNVSKWGGLVICGIASNNLTQAANAGAGSLSNGTGANGVGNCEGITPNVAGTTRFGAGDAAFPTANDADNSGTLTYVSLRHCGALLGGAGSGNEMNALSLCSVGSGTTLHHIETVASGDDDVEYFGGTVNVKYISAFFGDDDKFDYDLGYKGKAQFYFAVAADSLNSGDLKSSDNGIEADADDQFGAINPAFPYQSNPQIWNATFISNGKLKCTYDNTGHAGLQAKEMCAGSIRNSIFANFRSGVHFSEARDNANQKGDAYDQWTNGTTSYQEIWTGVGGVKYPAKQSLIVKDNIIIKPAGAGYYGFTRGVLVTLTGAATGKFNKDLTGANDMRMTPTAPTAADTLQFITTDHNSIVASVPGITTGLAFNGSNTGFTTEIHAVPLTNQVSTSTPPSDGFFTVVNYKGAFDAAEASNSWLSGYGQLAMSSLTKSNPTDINQDGVTDINDFAIFIGKFGQLDK